MPIRYLRRIVVVVASTVVLGLHSKAEAQAIDIHERPWTGEVLRPSGQPVIPLYEGWFRNQDGTNTLCFGYFNLNTEESLEIPLGPDNFMTPTMLDGAQPTWFEPVPESGYRRRWCAFTVRVPASFGADDQVVWTLRTGEETLSVPGHTKPPFVLDELRSGGRGDIAPVLRFAGGGGEAQGRTAMRARPMRARVGQPLRLELQVEHPEGRAWVGWAKHQGPGTVTFGEAEIQLRAPAMTAVTTATFSQPGEYLLRVQSIDSLAAFEFHCCWTNAYVPVSVQP